MAAFGKSPNIGGSIRVKKWVKPILEKKANKSLFYEIIYKFVPENETHGYMPKLYFRNIDDEFCYPLKKHLDDAKEEGLQTIELYEAIVDDSIKGFFFCNYFDMVCEKEKDTCGKMCEGYAPRNGKSGMCKHQKKTMAWGDEKKLFKVK